MTNRGGPTLAALLVGAGLIFHTSGGRTPTPKPPSGLLAAASSETANNEGPWVASCQYWSSRRQEPAATATTSRAAERVDAHGKDLQRPFDTKAKATSECASANAANWEVPDDLQHENARFQAHSVIATVPDPVHSHLALEFDRIMDALIGSASDNGYSLSYSWLPWKAPRSATGAIGESRQTSEEPGLLIFDRRPAPGRSRGVLYMFVVAEMPADELNAEQLKKALSYELQLRSVLGSQFATDERGSLRVIGPLYSGSAMSLIETIHTMLRDELPKPAGVTTATIAGATETEEAYRTLNQCMDSDGRPCLSDKPIRYLSFASSNEVTGLLKIFQSNGYKAVHAVVLHEDGTIFGVGGIKEGIQTGNARGSHVQVNSIPFPRDFSLLRNSQRSNQSDSESDAAGAPSPYLPLTTRDEGSQDTLPHFSTDITPLSQEAQVMAISHTLTQLHADFAYIAASNPMDALFLAKWLRRSNPDTRLVMEPDLLLQREGEDTAYIGTLSISPYPPIWLARSAERPERLRSFASAAMEAYYNAASYTLGQINPSPFPILYGYGSNKSGSPDCPQLWLTAVGSDGYYPVAVLTTPSDMPGEPQLKYAPAVIIYPSHVWQALCVLLVIAALLHIAALCSASYASPLTCDLDIRENTMPHRRGLYGQIGGAALFLMSVVAAYPVTTFLNSPPIFIDRQNLGLGIVTLSLGALSWLIAIIKTFRAMRLESRDAPSLFAWGESRLCLVLYWGSIAASLVLAAMWVRLCTRSLGPERLGAFFSYRCLHPTSGVSPLAPALLVLWGWFFWGLMHARRLRLTMDSRPIMPNATALEGEDCPSYKRTQPDMFVSDTRLQMGLLEDTTCLMISRRFLHQIFRVPAAVRVAKDSSIPSGVGSGIVWKSRLLDTLLMLSLAGLAALWIGLCPVRALDHFGQAIGSTTLYELFMGLLLVPLLVIALCAAARLFLISASLRAHLLEPLERMPLRQAFTRLKGFHWVSMLRESGQLERWRDMSRSTEGIRQILNDPEMPINCMSGELTQRKMELEEEIARLQQHIKALRDAAVRAGTKKRAWEYMEAIEKMYARCSEIVLCCILLPYWLGKRHSLMQSVSRDAAPEKEPNIVLLAEELLAIRYVAIIRAVLAQMRYLLLFITVALVLIMLATNSYPFQPKQEIDWCVTGLFLSFSAGIVVVLAQMHRNSLLSRITNKNSKSLGLDFYLRVAGFGAVPLITWLATQYPSIGGTLYSVVKPGLEVMK